MGGGYVSEESSCSRVSSSTSIFNDECRMLDCWCPKRCVIPKASTLKNSTLASLCTSTSDFNATPKSLGFARLSRLSEVLPQSGGLC
ncbi:hypothetical protein MTR_7g114430 [Medicago truncatula]|uniref:Uncharacterized protein n=1 Tax=Medicago truncatula TaxID=3880 RepID=G7L0S6_MEDTR|nr:hypothetical protein MTR_7g114430 [Medicago truncatula]